jgi:serine protease Do
MVYTGGKIESKETGMFTHHSRSKMENAACINTSDIMAHVVSYMFRVLVIVCMCAGSFFSQAAVAQDKPADAKSPKDSVAEKADGSGVAEDKKPAAKIDKKPGAVSGAKKTKQAASKKTAPKGAGKTATGGTYELDDRLALIAQKVIPSVVSVHVSKGQSGNTFSTATNPSFPENAPTSRPVSITYGSGIILDKRGNIATNYHVVRNADAVKVQLSDLREYTCDVIGVDPATDIAVIRITLNVPPDLSPVEFADSDKVRTGQLAVAVGNAYGFSNTVTMGIISSVGRSSNQFVEVGDYLQTDASLNPGNSGGALVDSSGKLIGMNTAIYSRSGGNVGLGFSIPANTIRAISARIISQGIVIRGWSGMIVQDLNPDIAAKLSLPQGRGVVVTDVVKGSPADASGLATGDVILTIDGTVIPTARAMQQKIIDKRPGDKTSITVSRKGKKTEFVIYMGNYPDMRDDIPVKKSGRDIGLYVGDLDEELSARFNINDNRGVVVVRLDTGRPAESSGVEIGDLVKEIDGKPVPDLDSFSRVIDELRDRNSVLFLLKRNNQQRFITVYLR